MNTVAYAKYELQKQLTEQGLETLSLLYDDYLHSLKTYQKNGKLALAMQDQAKAQEEQRRKTAEDIAT